MEPEKDPFVSAFVHYLEAVQEATCDRLLEKGNEKAELERLSITGKNLVAETMPPMRPLAKKVTDKIEELERSGGLVSDKVDELKLVADSLKEFRPYLEERELVFYAGFTRAA